MIIFFQKIKVYFKLNLLFLFLIALIQSCNSHKSGDSEKQVLNEDSNSKTQNIKPNSNELKSTIPPRFLDTIKLKNMGIAYQKLGSNKYYDQWLLKLTDTLPKSKQILGLTYNILTSMHDNNNHVLFQLDSLFIQLSDIFQAFGFNGDGAYLHTYESLLKPDILFDDYNFDGVIDFSIQSGGSGTNEVRYYYIFNPKRKSFNKPISMANASFDKRNKLVYQSWHMSAATWSKSSYRYSKVDTLLMIQSENKEYIDSIDSYVKEVKLMRDDGTYSITLDTIKRK